MKRLAISFALVLVATYGAIGAPEAQASREDFRLSVAELDSALGKLLKIQPFRMEMARDGAVTREEVIEQLDQLLEYYRPKFRVTPRPFAIYPDVIEKYNRSAKTQDSLKKLGRWGAVAPVGPIVVAPGPGMSEEELGDILGYFYAQVTYLSHQPDPRWTPALSNE